MKKLDITTIAETVTLSRRDKLLRWARLIRESGGSPLFIFHELEHWSAHDQRRPLPPTPSANAFSLAAKDPVFAAMGLGPYPSLDEAKKFFELTSDQLHMFSCDCGGHISNEDMARRVEHLAEPSTEKQTKSYRPTFLQRW